MGLCDCIWAAADPQTHVREINAYSFKPECGWLVMLDYCIKIPSPRISMYHSLYQEYSFTPTLPPVNSYSYLSLNV